MFWLWLWRMMVAVTVALMPGGFLLLLAYVAVRTLRERWRHAQAEAQLQGSVVSMRAVLATVELKELVRQARSAL